MSSLERGKLVLEYQNAIRAVFVPCKPTAIWLRGSMPSATIATTSPSRRSRGNARSVKALSRGCRVTSVIGGV